MDMNLKSLTDEDVEVLALGRVNAIRIQNGMKPLRNLKQGRKGEAEYCSLARSLRNGEIVFSKVDGNGIKLYGKAGSTDRVSHSPETREFMRRFDAGKYPHLIYPA